mmetsp:Transcript_18405/g.36922  ORF Transcript_18405/g.36922 Transcript_18405/m.36922 type:complete len:1032 (-) Transcript_18405:76-3171(-)
MSYNYDECVQSIQQHRQKAYEAAAATTPDLDALQQSMDGFASLSKICPMTPLLWMQYAQDTKALMEGLWMMEKSATDDNAQQQQLVIQAKKEAYESSAGILELALIEFPGCALLHLYNLENLIAYICECGDIGSSNKVSSAFLKAWQSVGKGTHVNEGFIVSDMFRLFASFLLLRLSLVAKQQPSQSALIMDEICSLFDQWSRTPMGEGSNEEMMQDMDCLWEEACSLILSSYDEANESDKINTAKQLEGRKATLWASIDANRRITSSLTNILSSCENEIDVAMSNEGITLPWLSLFQTQQDQGMPDSKSVSSYLESLKQRNTCWDRIVLAETDGAAIRFLLGLGGAETSRSFLKAISYIRRNYQDLTRKGKGRNGDDGSPLQDHVAGHGHDIIVSLYERAISECPTVETLWASYMKFLSEEFLSTRDELKKGKQNPQDLQQQQSRIEHGLLSASRRSIRNCPYSSALFEKRMTTIGLVSINLEPDDISAVIKEAIELGFLTSNKEAMLHLRLVAIHVVKRRLLSLISLRSTGKDFDEDEVMNLTATKKQKSPKSSVMYQQLDPSVIEEVKDLIEDIRDMYDEAENYLFKSHATWVEGKVTFWKHRATSEAYVLCPIAKNDANDDMTDVNRSELQDKEAIRCFEKLVKAEKPSNPDSWMDYIRYVSSSHVHSFGGDNIFSQLHPDGFAAVPSIIRKTRGLYNRALSSVRKAGQSENSIDSKRAEAGLNNDMFERNYDNSLLDLCREFLCFERAFGSEESLSRAQTLVRSKMAQWTAPPPQMITNGNEQSDDTHGKRKAVEEVPSNDAMEEDGDDEMPSQSRSKKTKVQTNLKQPKKTEGVHKVRIGKLEYPAHPYTIHVSNLSKETQDMDLVDVFRKEVGGIVHVKILREKKFGKGGHHSHGESKCAGLVQFEECISVENALLMDGTLDVGGKLIKIQRSHLPAVGIVPQGMHRVKPKGEGKSSKRNEMKKGPKLQVDTSEERMDCDNGGDLKSSKISGASNVETPSSISLSVLSFKPRNMKRKPILDTKK